MRYSRKQVEAALSVALEYPKRLRKILLVPPDFTRGHSQQG